MAIVPYWITDVYCGLNVTCASPLIQVNAPSPTPTQANVGHHRRHPGHKDHVASHHIVNRHTASLHRTVNRHTASRHHEARREAPRATVVHLVMAGVRRQTAYVPLAGPVAIDSGRASVALRA
jgi:hypothetical protein